MSSDFTTSSTMQATTEAMRTTMNAIAANDTAEVVAKAGLPVEGPTVTL